jgi:hypothetical protein
LPTVAGETDDSPGAVRPAEPSAELADQEPGCAGVDGEVPVEALGGGVEQAGVDGLAMAQHQTQRDLIVSHMKVVVSPFLARLEVTGLQFDSSLYRVPEGALRSSREGL